MSTSTYVVLCTDSQVAVVDELTDKLLFFKTNLDMLQALVVTMEYTGNNVLTEALEFWADTIINNYEEFDDSTFTKAELYCVHMFAPYIVQKMHKLAK